MPPMQQRALVVTRNDSWGNTCISAFERQGYAVDRAVSGVEAMGLMHKKGYSYVAVDDSLPDLDPIEFGLGTRETAQSQPKLLVGLHRVSALRRIADPCHIVHVDSGDGIIAAIPRIVAGS